MNQPVPPPAASFLPYGLHSIDEADIAAVAAAMRSGCLAHGPRVAAFETAFAAHVGAPEAVACSGGTPSLHLALAALDVGPGDLCIVPAITFLATATAARMCGADVLFADVDPDTGLLTPETLADALGRADRPVKAVLPVHLGGRIADMSGLAQAARAKGSALVEDACHAAGGVDARGVQVGACDRSDAACFSFHPVKTLAAGEGGMITTRDPARADRMRRLRNHGVVKEARLMRDAELSLDNQGSVNPWSYEQIELGFNYRMNEMEAALALSQLSRLDRLAARRRALAQLYDALLAPLSPVVRPIAPGPGRPSPHLYQVMIDFESAGVARADLMRRMAARGIGTQVHYIPVYRQPYFRALYGDQRLPGSEAFYARVLALPLFPAMDDRDPARVADALAESLGPPG